VPHRSKVRFAVRSQLVLASIPHCCKPFAAEHRSHPHLRARACEQNCPRECDWQRRPGDLKQETMPAKPRKAAAPELTDREIAQRAYQRWQARGCPLGDGREDWLAAEAELRAERTRHSPLRSALRRLGI
jgi:hypothetical protein